MITSTEARVPLGNMVATVARAMSCTLAVVQIAHAKPLLSPLLPSQGLNQEVGQAVLS